MRRLLCVGVVLASVMALAACKIDDSGSVPQQAQKGESAQKPGQAGAPQGIEGPQGGPDGTPQPGPTFDPTAAATLQELNRLSVGMLYLAESGHPLSKGQAVTLLPYWQDIQAAMQPPQGQGDQTPGSPSGQGPDQTPQRSNQGRDQGGGRFFMALDASKIEGDLADIRAALTQEQVSDINAMTQDQMTATLQKYGLNSIFGFGGPGGRNGGPGGGNGGFFGTPGAFETARAEGTFPSRPTPDANELATRQAGRGSGQGQRGNPVIAEVIKSLQALAGG